MAVLLKGRVAVGLRVNSSRDGQYKGTHPVIANQAWAEGYTIRCSKSVKACRICALDIQRLVDIELIYVEAHARLWAHVSIFCPEMGAYSYLLSNKDGACWCTARGSRL
jgi:hypothetical protein